MGYLITVQYSPKKQDGSFGFDLEQTLEKQFKVGKKEEEVSEQQLAIAVLKQLSRRDIYVRDIDIVEFVQKHIKVKEAKNGIIIGGKKYSFNDVQDLECTVEEEAPPVAVQAQTQVQPQVFPAQKAVIKQEFFDPEPAYKSKADQFRQMGLTIGKKYGVVYENGYIYRIVNDTGGTIDVPIQHFTATLVRETAEESNEIPLSFPGEIRGQELTIR